MIFAIQKTQTKPLYFGSSFFLSFMTLEFTLNTDPNTIHKAKAVGPTNTKTESKAHP